MDERWMVDDARDELILTVTLMQRLHDKLRFSLLAPEQADATTGAMLGQLKQALALVDASSRRLHCLSARTTVAPSSAAGALPVAVAEPFGVEKKADAALSPLEAEIYRQAARMWGIPA